MERGLTLEYYEDSKSGEGNRLMREWGWDDWDDLY